MATKRDFVISYGLQADKSSGSSDTLFVDYLNDKVGVGSTQPSEKLHVEGNLHVTGNVTVGGTYPSSGGGGATNLDGLTDVVIATPSSGQVLKYDGTNWVNGGDINLGDNNTIYFGDSSDLQILHDGTNSRITNGTGDLIIKTDVEKSIIFQDGTSDVLAQFTSNGSVELYHNNFKRFETTEVGASVDGTLNVTTLTASNNIYLSSTLDFSLQNNLLQLEDTTQAHFNINVPQLKLSIYGGSERARLTSTGFGIVGGTVSGFNPSVPLEIYSNNGNFLKVKSQYSSAETSIGDNFIKFSYIGGSVIDSTISLSFRNPSNFTTALLLDTVDKRVVVNNTIFTSDLNQKLQVTGDAYVSGSVTAAGQSSKLRFYFAALTDLPLATDWHGMFAHVHDTGKAYYAHGGNWVELANTSDIPAAYSLPTATVGTSITGTLGGVKVDGSTITITDGVISATGGGGGSSNSFATIAISGQSNVVADSSTDTLTLVAGSGITLTTNATSDSITITSTGGGGGISNLVEDTTPQLGGSLDLNSRRIIHDGSNLGGTDGDISFIPTNAVFNTTAGGMIINVRNSNSVTWSTHTILGPNVTIDGSVTANSFVKSGGTSSQYLMADGSVTTSAGGGGGGISESLAIAYAIAL